MRCPGHFLCATSLHRDTNHLQLQDGESINVNGMKYGIILRATILSQGMITSLQSACPPAPLEPHPPSPTPLFPLFPPSPPFIGPTEAPLRRFFPRYTCEQKDSSPLPRNPPKNLHTIRKYATCRQRECEHKCCPTTNHKRTIKNKGECPNSRLRNS